jgi:hypothetical protein
MSLKAGWDFGTSGAPVDKLAARDHVKHCGASSDVVGAPSVVFPQQFYWIGLNQAVHEETTVHLLTLI